MKCKLRIKDQVNVKFEDLDPLTRKALVKALSFVNPKARHMPAFKLGRWDGKVAFATIGGGTYFNLLETALPVVLGAGYELDIVDERKALPISFEHVDSQFFAHVRWPDGHPKQGEPIVLNDHQVEAINRYLTPNPVHNYHSLQSLSTSSGKTIITAALSKQAEKYGRTLVIVPGKDLVTQTLEDYVNVGLDAGIYFSDFKQTDNKHIISTWQSLTRMLKDESENFYKITKDVAAIIVDECFAEHTRVLTPDGYRPIGSLAPGDKITNYDEQLGVFKEDEIVKLHRNLTASASEDMLELTFDNGSVLEVTANHKFLTDRGWVRADELRDDDRLVSINTNADREKT